METNPKKSRAIIITAVIMLILLVGGYFLFTKTSFFSTKGIAGKTFAPLLGTSQNKNLNVLTNNDLNNNGIPDNQEVGTTGSGATGGTTGTSSGQPAGGSGPQVRTTTGGMAPLFRSLGLSSLGFGGGSYNDPCASASQLVDNFGQPCNGSKSTYKTILPKNYKPACSDGLDNDGDGLIDRADPGCHTDLDPTHNGGFDVTGKSLSVTQTFNPANAVPDTYDPNKTNEYNFIPACSDGIDNDGDGLIDIQDPGCHTDLNPNNLKSYDGSKTLEYNFIPQCSDGVDNDGDKLIDSADPGCHTNNHIYKSTNELCKTINKIRICPLTPLEELNMATYDPNKNLEYNFVPQCSDGIDNDGDGLIDDKDPGCHTDGNASNPKSYDPNYGSEYTYQFTPSTTTSAPKACNEDLLKLKFTDAELAQLKKLTDDFNKLAPFLKSPTDVDEEKKSAINYQYITDNAKDLTRQCLAQTSTNAYKKNDYGQGPGLNDTAFDYSSLDKGRFERIYTPYFTADSWKLPLCTANNSVPCRILPEASYAPDALRPSLGHVSYFLSYESSIKYESEDPDQDAALYHLTLKLAGGSQDLIKIFHDKLTPYSSATNFGETLYSTTPRSDAQIVKILADSLSFDVQQPNGPSTEYNRLRTYGTGNDLSGNPYLSGAEKDILTCIVTTTTESDNDKQKKVIDFFFSNYGIAKNCGSGLNSLMSDSKKLELLSRVIESAKIINLLGSGDKTHDVNTLVTYLESVTPGATIVWPWEAFEAMWGVW